MSRVNVPSLNDAPAASRATLEEVHKQLGVVPNVYRLIANSPTVLGGFAANNSSLKKTLDTKLREQIALTVAQVNGCDYCLSAHTYLGLNVAKITPQEVELNRKGASGDPKAHAAIAFATKVARERGHVTDADLNAVRAAGYNDANLVEIIAVVAENFFTNLLNEVAKTDIDFPVVRASEPARAA